MFEISTTKELRRVEELKLMLWQTYILMWSLANTKIVPKHFSYANNNN